MREKAEAKHLVYRLSEQRDLEDLIRLRKELLDYHARLDDYWRTLETWQEPLRSWFHSAMLRDDHRLFVAEIEGEGVIAYCLVSLQRFSPARETQLVGYIVDLIVEERFRRQGIGSALLDMSYSWFREHDLKRVELKVALSNEASRRFWERKGFQPFMELRWREL